MEDTQKIHEVAATLFFILGFGYLAGGLALRNGVLAEQVILGMGLMDIPLALVALLYGGTGLYMQINQSDEDQDSPWALMIVALCVLLFGAVVFVNLGFPSRI